MSYVTAGQVDIGDEDTCSSKEKALDDLVEVLQLADRFLMADLLAQCGEGIAERLNCTNAARVAARIGFIERAKWLQVS